MSAARRAQFKAPPLARHGSQEARRTQALEDQKRRRTQRIDSARNLDLFAGLTLGPSDDEADADPDADPALRTGVGAYAALLQDDVPAPTSPRHSSPALSIEDVDPRGSNHTPKKGRRRRRGAPSKYADKCMYAELLEMRADAPWGRDGLPADLATGWAVLAPVPAGKRCLVVTYTSSGVAGNVPNTQLRSRLLGKPLVRAFPSPLPPHTVLDCILDSNWRTNGVLHVLDVVRWKAQDVGTCEAAFRFWFRDARLAELPPPAPPLALRSEEREYRFPYPTTFIPVPHAPDTSLPALLAHVIPTARTVRTLDVPVPAPAPPPSFDISMLPTPLPTPAPRTMQTFVPARAQTAVQPDGLLLYVREAGYEPGPSPLSHWVPIELAPPAGDASMDADGQPSRPLDLFEWLVRRQADSMMDT